MKVIVYARSASAIKSKGMDSIQNQLARLTKYAKEKGMDISGVYFDSGTKGGVNTSGFQKLMKDLVSGDISAEKMLCTSTHRLSRSYFKVIHLLQQLEKAKVELEFIDELILPNNAKNTNKKTTKK